MSKARLRRVVLLCLGLVGTFASPAAAATVTLGTDTLLFPQPGELRYEIGNAAPGETVEIAPGVNPLVRQGNILIDKNLTIEGQGANATTISVFASTSRIFKIGSLTPAAAVTIRDLQMVAGKASDGYPGTGDPGQGGGAIHTNADLTLDRVLFFLNRAGDGASGAAGTNGNPSGSAGDTGGPGGAGGAVFNQVGGTLRVTDSTFEGNQAGDGGAGGQGGNGAGMFPFAGAGGAGGVGQDGGAIQNTGVMTVTNSTFFDNRSGKGGAGGDKGFGLGAGGAGGDGGDGGAVHQGGAGSVTISNSTIAGNIADLGGDGGAGTIGPAASGAGGVGGGSYFFIAATVANSLYSLNTAVSGSNCAGSGTITGVGANLSFPAGGCPGSFSNGDPQLAGIAANGGPTPTMALGPGSAAINQVAVGAPNCPGADQRGVVRPQGSTCDIGAFELEMATPPEPPVAGGSPPAAGLPAAAGQAAVVGAGQTPATKRCAKGRKLNRKTNKCLKKKCKKGRKLNKKTKKCVKKRKQETRRKTHATR